MRRGCVCATSVSGKQRAAFEPGNEIENARFFHFWSFFLLWMERKEIRVSFYSIVNFINFILSSSLCSYYYNNLI